MAGMMKSTPHAFGVDDIAVPILAYDTPPAWMMMA